MTPVTYHAVEAFRASRGLAPSLRIILGRAAGAAFLMDGGPCDARDEILAEVGMIEQGIVEPPRNAGFGLRSHEEPKFP